jgi:hypothetical protein
LEVDPVIPAQLDRLKVSTTLFDHVVTLSYSVGTRGCGVESLVINGERLSFERAHNAYRTGAARFSKSELRARLREGTNSLEISLGH